MTKVTDMNDFMDRKIRQEVGFAITEGWLEPSILDGEKAYTITKKGLEIVARIISVTYISDVAYEEISKDVDVIDYGDKLIQDHGNPINFLLSSSLELKELGVTTTKDFEQLMDNIIEDIQSKFGIPEDD